ncbi:MAG: hypothetical protein ACK56G_07790, partial [Pirellulaceae bacterium]
EESGCSIGRKPLLYPRYPGNAALGQKAIPKGNLRSANTGWGSNEILIRSQWTTRGAWEPE